MAVLHRYRTIYILLSFVIGISITNCTHNLRQHDSHPMQNSPLYPDKRDDGCHKDENKNLASIDRSAALEGFHRDLITKINFRSEVKSNLTSFSDQCSLLLVERLPTGIYVDLDQVAEMERLLKDISVISSDRIDVEKPAHLSTEHLLLVYARINPITDVRSTKVSLPIHLRYHLPQDDWYGYTEVVMPRPMLILIHCDKELPEFQCQPKYTAPCSNSNKSSCVWNLLYDNENEDSGNEIILKVPVGIVKHGVLVSIGTIISAIAGTIILIIAIKNAFSGKATYKDRNYVLKSKVQ
ncbi:uncharacterized protein TRIADDRAFT_53638 [Trichoplax adhaerens]|uniref:Phosphatidylinositol-glycan biosynthesis class X protein n=1 Tax=Trichoplax adhaerens TaxID=10228 RepID=B3RPR7_TRIAD|nr:hypothetical protein TRIADDRAFT_53638 [Trichoplax adhaerens]EDV27687.1 hypothetical protein TRIADDRAFT_53638 [Trichoplax adhaerens]|eukprot:XP_002109521.1 hypothetical protein TRIADDRAFT_53638 [Trichoplax adhaerens]